MVLFLFRLLVTFSFYLSLFFVYEKPVKGHMISMVNSHETRWLPTTVSSVLHEGCGQEIRLFSKKRRLLQQSADAGADCGLETRVILEELWSAEGARNGR